MELLARTGVGRDINRHYYTAGEIAAALERPVVRGLLELIRFRNRHAAFQGEFNLPNCSDRELVMEWRSDAEFARLEVDLAATSAVIVCSTPLGVAQYPVGPATAYAAEDTA